MPALEVSLRPGVTAPGRFLYLVEHVAWAGCLGGLLLTVYLIYSIGASFGLSLDDGWNLDPLGRVTDARTALEFVFGGVSGPLGRPVALATFLLDRYSWPGHPQDLIRFNILLHLLNTVLLVWLVNALTPYLSGSRNHRAWLALAVGVLWAASPLLMSASLMVIQRMTLLSAMFTLVGLILYVRGRECAADRPLRGAVLMCLGIGGGTMLGALSKENGVLLPAFALLLDRLYLDRAIADSEQRRITTAHLRAILTWIPVTLLCAYLVYLAWQGAVHGFHGRTFNLSERLLTEARVLWDYLRLLLLPARSALGPYHDDYVVSQGLLSPPTTILGLIGLAALIVTAWKLKRGSWRVVSFGIAWFLVGHVLESTVVPLEIYFEHRNYVPAIGVYIAVVFALERWNIEWKYGLALCFLMIFNFLFILHENARTWSDPLLAGMLWHREHPASLRTVQHVGRELARRGRKEELVALFEAPDPRLEGRADYSMMRSIAYCGIKGADDVRAELDRSRGILASAHISPPVTEVIDKLVELIEAGRCQGVAEDEVLPLVSAVIESSDPDVRNDTRAMAHEIAARLVLRRGQVTEALAHLEKAFALRPTISDGMSIAALLVSMGRYEEAEQSLERLRALAPPRPFVRDKWLATVAEMQEIVDQRRTVVVSPASGDAE